MPCFNIDIALSKAGILPQTDLEAEWNTGRSGLGVRIGPERGVATGFGTPVHIRLNGLVDRADAEQLSAFFKRLSETL
jgi:hypothetical protein